MSALRPLPLAISSAVLASGVTWLIVRPPPAQWIGSSGLQPGVPQHMLEPLPRREPNPSKKTPDQKPRKRPRSN